MLKPTKIVNYFFSQRDVEVHTYLFEGDKY